MTLKRSDINHSIVLDAETQRYICNSIAAGVQIKDIIKSVNITINNLYDYAAKDPLFEKEMQKARVYQQYLKVDELLNVTDGCETMAQVARAKVISDNTKWTAGKFNPSVFADNINVSVSHHLDLSSILLAAENRVLPILQAKTALQNGLGSTIDIESIPVAVVELAQKPHIYGAASQIECESIESIEPIELRPLPAEWI